MEAYPRQRIEDNGESSISLVGDTLKQRIIGQDPAIDAIMTAFDRAMFRDERRPVASLMFLGQTGTGKTQTAEALADVLAVDKLNPAILRIDCAQYAQGHEVANLVGSPPGYVGREQAPVLNKQLIEQPGSVVLFDEIEKGHPRLHNYLLQIMEGGNVNLMGTGETVNFNNATVIMTSNVGAREMNEMVGEKKIGFGNTDATPTSARIEAAGFNALKKQFSPEFLNRLDGVITFNSLSDEQLTQVLDTHVERSNHRYRRMGNVALRMTQTLKEQLVEGSPLRKEFGARPVLRKYEQDVEAKLSRLATSGKIGGNYILADYEDDKVEFYEDEPLEGAAELLQLAELIAIEEPGVSVYDDPDDEPICVTDEPKQRPRPKRRKR